MLVFTYQCGEDVMIILGHHSHGESLSDRVEDSVKRDVQMNAETHSTFYSAFDTHTNSLSFRHSTHSTVLLL